MIELTGRVARLSDTQRQLLEERLRKKPSVAEPIAIVGMACRFPGAKNLDEYWRLIDEGVDATGEIPPSRWDADEFYEPTGEVSGKMATRWGGFVDDVDQFDPAFFGITPREAAKMDPQQRLLLEVSWEALEQAAIAPHRLAESATGVFIGIGGADYAKVPIPFDDYLEHIDPHSGTGNALSIAANRLSYVLDLRGPSIAIDTACSSGLVAVHLAVQSLRNRECDAALAGGVNLILTPETTIAFSKSRMLSADGRCRPFSADANGYVRGEGCGVLVLKRLTDAVVSGDRVLAILRASAVNQDGRTSGITAPNALSQHAVIRTALKQAGLSARRIGYVEAHGTGTPLGDPIEIQALSQIFRLRSEDDGAPCYVSSVKANIGHLETVSGIAGIIKVALMMQHAKIPAQLHLNQLNPKISFSGTRLRIPQAAVDWPTGPSTRVAGVSSFGFGGTNAHVILEEATPSKARSPQNDRPLHLLTVSAKTQTALDEKVERFADWLESHTEAPIANVCFSANEGRTHFNHRLAVTANDANQLIERLRSYRSGKRTSGVATGQVKVATRPHVAFLFTGQGSQYAGMGRALYDTHPQFRGVLDECANILSNDLEVPLLDVMFGDSGDTSRLDETAYTQTALFSLEYALCSLWREWGVEPDVVLGHSVGEYVAACVAGVFSLEDGLRLIAERARRMDQLPRNGLMSVVFLPASRVVEAIGPYRDRVAIAAANGPENTVISGESEAVRLLAGQFEADGVRTQLLTVSHAFHSPLMEPMLDEFQRFAETIEYQKPQVPVVSNRTGQLITETPNARYWREHIRGTVRFEDGMVELARQDVDVMLEIGPSPSLLGMGRRCRAQQRETAWLTSLRKGLDGWHTMLGALAELYACGVRVDWRGLDLPWRRRRLSLPTYPFQRTRHWYPLPEHDGRPTFARVGEGRPIHPLLASDVATALESRVFQTHLSSQAPGYLADHVVQGSAVMPAAAYLEQALAAAERVLGPGSHQLENVSIQNPMFLPPDASRVVQLTASREQRGESTFEIYSAASDLDEPSAKWTLHACGRMCAESPTGTEKELEAGVIDLNDARERMHAVTRRDEFYALMAERGLTYGPWFQVLDNMRRSDRDAIAEVKLSDDVAKELSKYRLHPALLDGCFQSMAGAVPLEADGSYSPYTYMPTAIRRLRIHGALAERMFAYAVRTSADNRPSPELVEGNVFLVDEGGRVLVELIGVRVQRWGRAAVRDGKIDVRDCLYRVNWEPSSAGRAGAEPTHGTWLIFADSKGIGRSLAEKLRGHGHRCVVVTPSGQAECTGAGPDDRRVTFQIDPLEGEQYQRLLDEISSAGQPSRCGIVHLWSLDSPSAESPDNDMLDGSRRLGVGSLLQLVRQLARFDSGKPPALRLITQGAQPVTPQDRVHPGQSTLWGMGRVVAMEHPALDCRLIDLDPDGDADRLAESLALELDAESTDDQIAYRDGERRVARLQPAPLPERDGSSGVAGLSVPPDAPFRLRVRDPGSFDSLWFEVCSRRNPGPGQVEVEVRAAGLNFSDVLKAMGLYPGITDEVVPLGIECSGVVTAVGEGVDRFRAGDAVMGVAPYSFASHATTAEYALVHKPDAMADAEAATVPITFLTAYYALKTLADLQPNERVLIHAGAGGVGLAAIQIAQQVGAEVFATAGSDEKRDFLRSLGVRHVMSSRNLDFADEIMNATQRQGVDVVLNSLPGDAITASLSVLSSYGRFLEIGKTDIYQNRMIGLSPFQDNLSYFAIDLDRMLRQRPEMIRELYAELLVHFDAGRYRPLPLASFSAAETTNAFRFMAQRKNIGKVVVDMSQRPADAPTQLGPVRNDGAYLITGGLGALGLSVTEWLADQGAQYIVLLARRDAGGEAADRIAALAARGVRIATVSSDVADQRSLSTALGGLPPEFPPLRGVIHAAGVLDDGLLFDMDLARLDKVLAPKVHGAWNLHTATAEQPLDFFVMFSSVASVLGSPGQGNYAAGNAFLDGLAHYRHSLGLPAISINWGPWAEAGMAARADVREQIRARGMELIPPQQGMELLGRLLREPLPQITCAAVRWDDMQAAMGGRIMPLIKDLAKFAPSSKESGVDVDHVFLQQFQDTEPSQRMPLLENYLSEELSRIMGVEPDSIDVEQPLNTLGLDSLMAMELKASLEKRLALDLPMARLIDSPSVSSLAEFAAQSIGQDCDGAPADSQAAAHAEPKSWSPLVPLSSAGPVRLFCVHPAGGDVRCYYDLAKNLDASVVALRARGLDGALRPHTTVTELAADYVASLRKLQPDGPYHLAGWSTGGIFAYEMAAQLKAAGAELGAILLIDSPTPSIFDHVDLNDDARFLVDVVNFSNWFSDANMSIVYDQLRSQTAREQLETVLRQAHEHNVLPADATTDYLRVLIDACRAHVRAIMNYEPSSLDHCVQIIRPADKSALAEASGRDVADDLGWGSIVNHLTLGEMAGDHFSMMTAERAKSLAATIRAALEHAAAFT